MAAAASVSAWSQPAWLQPNTVQPQYFPTGIIEWMSVQHRQASDSAVAYLETMYPPQPRLPPRDVAFELRQVVYKYVKGAFEDDVEMSAFVGDIVMRFFLRRPDIATVIGVQRIIASVSVFSKSRPRVKDLMRLTLGRLSIDTLRRLDLPSIDTRPHSALKHYMIEREAYEKGLAQTHNQGYTREQLAADVRQLAAAAADPTIPWNALHARSRLKRVLDKLSEDEDDDEDMEPDAKREKKK